MATPAGTPQARYLVEDHVGDVEGLVEQLGLKNITIWGNSTGGRVAQVFAGKHPELVSAVISEDVGPERPRQIADNYSRRVAQEEAGWASEEELLAQLRKSNAGVSDAVLVRTCATARSGAPTGVSCGSEIRSW